MRFFFKPETTNRGVIKKSSCDGGKRAVDNLSSFMEGRKQGRGEGGLFWKFVSGPCSKDSCLAGKGKVGNACRERP